MKEINPAEVALEAIREFYIELFGVLVPGVFFVLLAAIGFLVPALNALLIVGDTPIWSEIKAYASTHSIVSVLVTMVFAYVAGQIFYRQDPKVPDQRSIQNMRRRDPDAFSGGCVRLGMRGADEYPYASLKEYLAQRGFEIADDVPWSGADFLSDEKRSKAQLRSKHFINKLKLRVKYTNDAASFDLVRNEGQVRMMSSLWHLSGTTAVLSLTGVVATLISIGVLLRENQDQSAQNSFEMLFWAALVLGVSLQVRSAVERFIHYQRVREIVQVLEAARLAAT